MALLALVDGKDVMRPGVARLLHPAPQRGPLLARAIEEARDELHAIAEVGQGGRHFLGVRAFDHPWPSIGSTADTADFVFDPADRVPRNGAEHDRTAKGDASGIVDGLIEVAG